MDCQNLTVNPKEIVIEDPFLIVLLFLLILKILLYYYTIIHN